MRQLTGGNGGHRPRSAGENRRENLASADPHGLRQRHLLHAFSAHAAEFAYFAAGAAEYRVYEPHGYAAGNQRPAHDEEVFQMLANEFGQQPGRNGGDDKGDERKGEWVSGGIAVPALAARKGCKEFGDARAKVNRQAENRAKLDDDGVHLPIAAAEINPEQGLADAKVRGGADGKKFGEAFDDSEQKRKQV